VRWEHSSKVTSTCIADECSKAVELMQASVRLETGDL
jgi:hypothetical protein